MLKVTVVYVFIKSVESLFITQRIEYEIYI
jgi:hypothetical protein